MATIHPTQSTWAQTYTLNSGDAIGIAEDITVASDYMTIDARANTTYTVVAGLAEGLIGVVTGQSAYVNVFEGGDIYGDDAAVVATGYSHNGTLYNSGLIEGGAIGIDGRLSSYGEIHNFVSGVIESHSGSHEGINAAVHIHDLSASAPLVDNKGVIRGLGSNPATDNYAILSDGKSWDRVQNSGQIIGRVSLGEGNDLFDSHTGTLATSKGGVLGAGYVDGGAGNDTIIGSAGNDVIIGGAGNDLLTGGKGRDTFVVDNQPGNSVDYLTDFVTGQDTLQIDHHLYKSLQAGVLPASELVTGKTAHDANDFLSYDAASGGLFYDPDGSGSHQSQLVAEFKAGTHLSAADIRIV